MLDRLILGGSRGDNQLKHKVGAALQRCAVRAAWRPTSSRRHDQHHGDGAGHRIHWNAVHGADSGARLQDIEGVEVIEKLKPQYRMDAWADRQGRNRAAGAVRAR